MSFRSFLSRSNVPKEQQFKIRFEGAGSSAPTVHEGAQGVAITRTGAGAYLITFANVQGTMANVQATLQAATPGDLAGHTVIADTFASGLTLPLIVYNASFAAHDLEANEYMNLVLTFRRGGQ